jgi:hypothetical protein
MLNQPTPARPDNSAWAVDALKHITLRQLREWQALADRWVVIPKPDEQAWEDTELDVRRISL